MPLKINKYLYRTKAAFSQINRLVTNDRLDENLRKLKNVFETENIAFAEELCTTWEFTVTMFLYRFFPKWIKTRITSLSSDIANIKFLNTIGVNTPPESEQSAEKPAKPEAVLPLSHYEYINYHSVQIWYRWVRQKISLMIFSPIFLAGYFVMLFLLLTFFFPPTFEKSITANFKVEEPGPYLIVLEGNQDQEEYSLEINRMESTRDEVIYQTDIRPLRFGDRITSPISASEPHVFRFEAESGDLVGLVINSWYSDNDLSFELLDEEMNGCGDEITLFPENADQETLTLTCKKPLTGYGYLIVTLDPSIKKPSRYQFGIYKVIEQPNLNKLEQKNVPLGSLIRGELGNDHVIRIALHADQGDNLSVVAKGLNKPRLSILRQSGNSYELTAYGSPPSEAGSDFRKTALQTPRGRLHFLLSTLEDRDYKFFIIKMSPDWVIDIYSYYGWIFALYIFQIIFYGWIFLGNSISTRKFEESKVVELIVEVLKQLNNDDALRSGHRKDTLINKINNISRGVRNVHKISRGPKNELDKHINKFAAQITQLAELVLVPDRHTLLILRGRFAKLLSVFLKSEFGDYEFIKGFQAKPIPRYKQLVSWFPRYQHFFLYGILLIPIVGFLTLRFWIGYWTSYSEYFISQGWLSIRYLLLIIMLALIYERWGPKETEDRWQSAGRFILSFLIPFVVLDTLLQTGILDKIIQFVGTITLF